jgi:GNAT superfamily N-acetyltransferase
MTVSETRPSARRAARAHDELVTALYGGELAEAGGLRLLYNRYLDEPTWSHAGAVEVESPAWTDGLAAIREFYRRRQRPPAVVTDPWTAPEDAAARLEREGWRIGFRHAGLLFPREAAVPAYDWPAGTTLEELASSLQPEPAADAEPVEPVPFFLEGEMPGERRSFPSMSAFLAVFQTAFGERRPSAQLAAFERAILAGFEKPRPGVELVHTVVSIDGQPAAVGSRVQLDGVTGLYNLGVAPPFRGRGLGAAMTLHRLASARAAGADTVFLLADSPRVEAVCQKRGFERAFELVGWTEDAA